MDKDDLEIIQESFGGHVPEKVLKAFEYADVEGPGIVCDFTMLAAIRSSVATWFNDDDAQAKRFIGLGFDRKRSIYGFWVYGDRTLDTAPIAFIDHERQRSRVLTNTFDEFVSLLALGWREIGRVDNWEASAKEGQCRDTQSFREWAKNELGIEPASDPRAIVDRALASHPDINLWISAWEHRRGKPGAAEEADKEIMRVVRNLVEKGRMSD